MDSMTFTAGRNPTAAAQFKRDPRSEALPPKLNDKDYIDSVWHARRMFVNMYDVREKRGWILDGATVVLHLSLAQISRRSRPIDDRSLISRLFGFRIGGSPSQVAVTVLTHEDNMGLHVARRAPRTSVTESHDEGQSSPRTAGRARRTTTYEMTLFHQFVRPNLENLFKMYADRKRIAGGINANLSTQKIYGWDFLDLINMEMDLEPKVHSLSKDCSWVRLTKEIDAINIFGRNLGQLLLPSENHILCSQWSDLPPRKEYLAACVSTIQEIHEKYGGDEEDKDFRLAKGVYWYQKDLLFEPCRCEPHEGHCCDRAQVLFPKSFLRWRQSRPKRIDDLVEARNGADVFGQSE